MWTREQLKTKAKVALNRNYWMIIVVTLLISQITGASPISFEFETDALAENLQLSQMMYPGEFAAMLLGLMRGAFLISAVVVVVSLLTGIFVVNPISVGAKRYYMNSLNDTAEAKELLFAFDHNYTNMVKVLFMKELKTFLWSLLFLIPGIVKAYEYRMIPYLLADYPEMTEEEAFQRSKEMMDGNKMEAFVLDLSFIGWGLLSILTAGLVGIFFLTPYENLTSAALYEELKTKQHTYEI